ncbi:hypothetical protein [Candidatus Mycobacterium methanotrophicum]|uniref:Uncharacterized protein n=1 Tax=Candidatus Mycobacterium methanotrophicum TaxID=2943498 RepID=A0ABY4QIQ6_9MYCO|nr:hypothetical protein [Candidatus Mycobacterium methanotrophicum]UQX10382.1 hypothetical protein M5I08_20025 [Candidatus Mycobacterium methanotrophicum]
MITMVDTSEPSLILALSTERARRQLSKDAAAKRLYDQKTMAANFAWMRPNELIFNYVVNNWLMGEDPPAFDIPAWNADSTNLPAAFDHDFIELYATNAASTGALTMLAPRSTCRRSIATTTSWPGTPTTSPRGGPAT